jgi:hypothetical protein
MGRARRMPDARSCRRVSAGQCPQSVREMRAPEMPGPVGRRVTRKPLCVVHPSRPQVRWEAAQLHTPIEGRRARKVNSARQHDRSGTQQPPHRLPSLCRTVFALAGRAASTQEDPATLWTTRSDVTASGWTVKVRHVVRGPGARCRPSPGPGDRRGHYIVSRPPLMPPRRGATPCRRDSPPSSPMRAARSARPTA